MKKSQVFERLQNHYSEKLYTRITRKRGEFKEITTGYVLGLSKEFVLIQETDDFRVMGYSVFPMATIKRVRYNRFDKTLHRITVDEGLIDQFQLRYKIDLTDWQSLCKSIKKTGFTVISECEHPRIQSFCIGDLKRVNKKSIAIRYFNAEGVYNDENTINRFKNITKISFDDRYANIFSKHAKKWKN